MGVELNIKEDEVPENATLIVGFPGVGMVGGMAADHLVGDFEMEQIGQIEISEIAPVAVVFNGRPRRPVRIFKGGKYLLVKSDVIVPKNCCPPLSKQLISWAKDNKIDKVVILDSIQSNKPPEETEDQVYGTISIHGLEEDLESIDMEILQRGVLSGPASMVSVECTERKVPAYGMYVKANPKVPDARSAAGLLEKLSRLLNEDINVEDLKDKAEDIEAKYEKMVQKTRKVSKEMEENKPISPMYG